MNEMKPVLWLLLLCLAVVHPAMGQQQGIVRTPERPGKPSTGIQGVTINVLEYPNSIVTKKGGKFSFKLEGKRPGESFTISRIQKKGYTLVDKQTRGRRYAYSPQVPIEIVLVADEQLEQDKKRIEDKAYDKARKTYDQKLEVLKNQLRQKTISENEYRTKYEELNSNYNNYIQLIDQMAERYATTDYKGLSDISRQTQECIENADLETANNLINSKGDMATREKKLVEKMQLKEKSERLTQQLQSDIDDELADLVKDYYYKFNIYSSNYQNDSAALCLERITKLDTTNAAWMNHTADFISSYLGDYPKAIQYYKQAYAIEKSQNGENSTDNGIILTGLALAYDNNNQPDTALAWHHKALDILTHAEDADSSDISMSYTLIGRAYSNLGEYEKALEYTLKGLEMRKRSAATDSTDLAQSYNNLGVLYSRLNDNDKALEYHFKALELREKVLGKDSFMAAFSRMNIGLVYFTMQDLDKAVEYLNSAYPVFHQQLGDAHPYTQSLLKNIAIIYSELGDYDKALEYCQEYSQGIRQHYGTKSVEAANSLNWEAQIHRLKGDWVQALKHYQQALDIYEKLPDDPERDLNLWREVIDELKEKIRQEQQP